MLVVEADVLVVVEVVRVDVAEVLVVVRVDVAEVLVVVVAASNVAIQPVQYCEACVVVPVLAFPVDETMFSRYAALIS